MSARSTEYRVIRSAAAEICFHLGRRFLEPTVLRAFRFGFILSCLVSSSESLRRSSLAARLRAAVLPGSHPSSRHHRKRPLVRELPTYPATFRPQVFATSRRFTPLSTLRAYCIPQPRPGFFRPGVSPDPQPSRLVAGPCPRVVVARTLTDRSRLPRSNASTPRPCSVNRCVPQGRGLAFPSVAPLFGFVLLQAPLTHHGTGSPAPPLVTFPSQSSHVPEST